jgi:hypothetical protein
MSFAAVHESVIGHKTDLRECPSNVGREAEIPPQGRDFRFSPTNDIAEVQALFQHLSGGRS